MFLRIKMSAGVALTTFVLGLMPTAVAQSSTTTLFLAPHCTEEDRSVCPDYEIENADHVKTAKLSVGDIVDLDIVVRSTAPQAVDSLRSWLTYDPAVLEARSVELSPVIRAPTPGEQDIDATEHRIKIGGSVNGNLKTEEAVVARVTFRVISAARDTVIAFDDFRTSGLGHTAVNAAPTQGGPSNTGLDLPCIDKLIGCDDTVNPMLFIEPSKLTVQLADPAPAPQVDVAEAAETPPVSENKIESTPREQVPDTAMTSTTGGSSAFDLLQVQQVRATTRDRDIYLGWQQLGSANLKAYNVYYGTVSGRYIQRKTIPGNSNSVIIRDMEPGTTYYMAIRALSNDDRESAFSQEVSVIVGDSASSTAPLLTEMVDAYPPVDGNPVSKRGGSSISGETGVSDTLVLLLLISAAIGTAFAAHRQFFFRRTTHA